MDFAILFGLILLNGVFAMSEMAIVSARKARLQQQIDAGSHGAISAMALAEDPGRFLSTVQVGITTIGILSGAFGESAIAQRLLVFFEQFPALAPYKQSLSTLIMVLVITFFAVVLGELVPKRLALLSPERIASTVAKPMQVLSTLFYPLVFIFNWASNFLLRLLGAKDATDLHASAEEINVMLKQGADAGVFEKSEQTMVGNVFRLDDMRVAAIMTPRRDIEYLNIDDDDAKTQHKLRSAKYQTFPVCKGDLDSLLGLLDAKDYLGRVLENPNVDLTSVLHAALFVPESISIIHLLETLRRKKSHLALIVDEYGGIEGMVTLTDILRAIIADVSNSDTSTNSDAVRRQDGSWLLDARLPPDRLNTIFKLPAIVLSDYSFNTLGGLAMCELGRIPNVGDVFEWQKLIFEIVDMDDNRVDRLLVSQAPGVNP